MNDENEKELARQSLQHIDNVFDKITVMVNHDLEGLGAVIDDVCINASCWFEAGANNREHALLGNRMHLSDVHLVIVRVRDGVGVRLHFANLVSNVGWDNDPAALEARILRIITRWEMPEKQHVNTRVARGLGALKATEHLHEKVRGAACLYAFRGVMCGESAERRRAVWAAYDLGVPLEQDGRPQQEQLWPVVKFLADNFVSVDDSTALFVELLWSRQERSLAELVAIVGALDKLKCHKAKYEDELAKNLRHVLADQFGDVAMDGAVHTDYLAYLGNHGLWKVTSEKANEVRDAFVALIASGGYPVAQQYMVIFGRELVGDVDRDDILKEYAVRAFAHAMETKRYGIALTLVSVGVMGVNGCTTQQAALAKTMTFGLKKPIGFTWNYVMPPKGWRPNK